MLFLREPLQKVLCHPIHICSYHESSKLLEKAEAEPVLEVQDFILHTTCKSYNRNTEACTVETSQDWFYDIETCVSGPKQW